MGVQGRVVEAGAPADLLAAGGRFADLWARQSSLDDVASPDAPVGAAEPTCPERSSQVPVLCGRPAGRPAPAVCGQQANWTVACGCLVGTNTYLCGMARGHQTSVATVCQLASHDADVGCKSAVQLLGVIAVQGSGLAGGGGGGPH